MSNKKISNSKNITNKIRSSLIIKLNFRMIGRLFIGFLKVNFLIILLSLFAILWRSEEGIQDAVKIIRRYPDNYQSVYYDKENYEIVNIDETKGGVVLPSNIQEWLPVDFTDAKRNIIVDKDVEEVFWRNIDLLKYTIEFSVDDSNYLIKYSLGNNLRLYIYLFSIVIAFEMLIVIGNIGKGSRAIRKTLKPLADLTETAKSLQAEVSSMGNKSNDVDIKDLAGAISSIDANKLDKRITVDSSQNELKELALAINDMLNRINSSYQAQVRFVSDASHELRTPISVIQGYVNLLDRWGKEDPKIMQESIDAIKSESENMKELIEQLLFLARGDNETIQLHKEDFDTCEIFDEIIRETQMIDSNHIFEVNLKGPAYINADKQLFKQAIRILVDNSIKYTPDGKKIILKVANKEGNVHMTVQDSGIGIKPDDLSNIFDRFYRSDESRARETGGSGLGLSIAKWIVDRHGAYFEILSRVDIGTRITIIFPAAEMKKEESITYTKETDK